jgi:poly(hydroxyalkanoate) depolymerase family esterase
MVALRIRAVVMSSRPAQERIMPRLSDTIARLAATRGPGPGAAQPSRLIEWAGFGANRGALRAYRYRPEGLKPGAPLVVVLHGCTQSAAAYDLGSGWSRLADRHGFALLFPEQQRSNNANLCFNWFELGDIRRDAGEASSIAEMIAGTLTGYGLDRRRVFVTGLSAGGAMAAVMLATYPELFAGGAVIAGLPYGSASTVPEALERMRGQGLPGEDALLRAVRAASPHGGPWPRLSVWHGQQDHVVVPAAGEAVLSQWRGLHGLAEGPSEILSIGPHRRRVWRDGGGVARIEAFALAGMGHGTPIDAGDGIGVPGPHMLQAGISSTRHIAAFWGIGDPVSGTATRPGPERSAAGEAAAGPGRIIEQALRAAGLMR